MCNTEEYRCVDKCKRNKTGNRCSTQQQPQHIEIDRCFFYARAKVCFHLMIFVKELIGFIQCKCNYGALGSRSLGPGPRSLRKWKMEYAFIVKDGSIFMLSFCTFNIRIQQRRALATTREREQGMRWYRCRVSLKPLCLSVFQHVC